MDGGMEGGREGGEKGHTHAGNAHREENEKKAGKKKEKDNI